MLDIIFCGHTRHKDGSATNETMIAWLWALLPGGVDRLSGQVCVFVGEETRKALAGTRTHDGLNLWKTSAWLWRQQGTARMQPFCSFR